jgi:hypothetical protein
VHESLLNGGCREERERERERERDREGGGRGAERDNGRREREPIWSIDFSDRQIKPLVSSCPPSVPAPREGQIIQRARRVPLPASAIMRAPVARRDGGGEGEGEGGGRGCCTGERVCGRHTHCIWVSETRVDHAGLFERPPRSLSSVGCMLIAVKAHIRARRTSTGCSATRPLILMTGSRSCSITGDRSWTCSIIEFCTNDERFRHTLCSSSSGFSLLEVLLWDLFDKVISVEITFQPGELDCKFAGELAVRINRARIRARLI